MRLEEVVARLVPLPDALPEGPPALMPVLADGSLRPLAVERVLAQDRPAAVLVLLVPGADGHVRVILTERPAYDGHHSGEVSFPGGKVEADDADASATALREAAEEVGLKARVAGVRVIGCLDEVWIPVSRFALTPVLAIAERRPDLIAHPAEVVRILHPLVEAFLPGVPLTIVERTVRGLPLRYGAYPVGADEGEELLLWGATARILGQLGALLRG
jgi:8-oxo-dGTP pyrophosphatase MutT (NUDIX family)